jgi:hypothetical protein
LVQWRKNQRKLHRCPCLRKACWTARVKKKKLSQQAEINQMMKIVHFQASAICRMVWMNASCSSSKKRTTRMGKRQFTF